MLKHGKLVPGLEGLRSLHRNMGTARVTNRLGWRILNPKETSTSALVRSEITIFESGKLLRVLLAIITPGGVKIPMPHPLSLEVAP